MNDQNQTFKLPENSWEFNQGENSFFDRAHRVWKNVIPHVFIDDVLEWSKYINSNEPELLNYVSKPEGLLLLDEWFKRMDCTPMREEWMKKSSEAKELFLEFFYDRTKKILDLSQRIEDFENSADTFYQEGRYHEALQLIKSIIADFEALDYFKETDNVEYFNFENAVQKFLWQSYDGRTKQIGFSFLNVRFIYYSYGWLSIKCNFWNDARRALEKAYKWDPVAVRNIFKLLETYSLDELDSFFDLLKFAYKFCYTKEDLAECYRGFAHVFIKKQKYKDALCCYKIGRGYNNRPNYMHSELSEIADALGGKIPEVTIEDILRSSEYYDYSIGVNREIFHTATYYGKKFSDAGDKEGAKEFYSILNDFFDNRDDEKTEYSQIVN